ncbi:MAG: hypothetical protein HWN67_19180 [Candidatus Helarchaeota archaeon]|nr:hypothetical protein [Candidatus Helarchaeota archaeon]
MAVNWVDIVVMYDLFKGFWLKSLAIGFWFIAIGYYFLLFAYIFFYRFLLKESKLNYWLIFSFFFLFLGIGRVANIIYDFYVPNPFYDQLGVGINWFSMACLAAIAGIMLIDNDKVSNLVATIIAIPPVIIGFIYPFIPAESLAAGSLLYILFNGIVLPAYGILVMALFIYLALQIPGDIRKKSILNTIGFIILFIGRGIYSKGARAILGLPVDLISIIASSLVVLSLIIFAFSTR